MTLNKLILQSHNLWDTVAGGLLVILTWSLCREHGLVKVYELGKSLLAYQTFPWLLDRQTTGQAWARQ